jgi:hypothetical protein
MFMHTCWCIFIFVLCGFDQTEKGFKIYLKIVLKNSKKKIPSSPSLLSAFWPPPAIAHRSHPWPAPPDRDPTRSQAGMPRLPLGQGAAVAAHPALLSISHNSLACGPAPSFSSYKLHTFSLNKISAIFVSAYS